jgi:hypothetical protein
MTVELNHTIIPAKDKWASAKFLADILNLEAGPEWGHFVPVKTGNGVTLDFSDSTDFGPRHFPTLRSGASRRLSPGLLRGLRFRLNRAARACDHAGSPTNHRRPS